MEIWKICNNCIGLSKNKQINILFFFFLTMTSYVLDAVVLFVQVFTPKKVIFLAYTVLWSRSLACLLHWS